MRASIPPNCTLKNDFMLYVFYHNKQIREKIILYWVHWVFKWKFYIKQLGVVLKTVGPGASILTDVSD